MQSNLNFREVRQELGMTQQEFGEFFGYKWHKIKDIESGKLKVNVEMAEKIENKYNISGWWLLTGKGEKYLNSEISTPKTIESKEDNRDSDDLPYVLLFDEFEKVPNNPSMKLILNKPKKIYRDNPLFRYLNIGEDISNLDEIICVDDISYGDEYFVRKYHIKDITNDIDTYLNMVKIDNSYASFDVIIKNNLLEKKRPLYEDKYLGVEGSISQPKDDNKRVIFKMDSYANDVLHSSEIQLTKDELKSLIIFGVEMFF